MAVKLRSFSNETLKEDIDFAVDYEKRIIIISEWHLGDSVRNAFGESDIEWFYEIDFKDLHGINLFLSASYSKKEFRPMNQEQKDFYMSCRDQRVADLFQYLLTFMENSNAYLFSKLIKEIGIEIKEYSF